MTDGVSIESETPPRLPAAESVRNPASSNGSAGDGWISGLSRYPHRSLIENARCAVAVYEGSDGAVGLVVPEGPAGATGDFNDTAVGPDLRLLALLPAVHPEKLGRGRFPLAHGCRFPYVVGEMARGIATAEMVIAAGQAGFLGFFGSAGLRPDVVGEAIDTIRSKLSPNVPWGMNLIHSPDHPEREKEIANLFQRQGVARISASAFMRLSPFVVRLSAAGLARTDAGAVNRKTHIFAKVSRPEVAEAFLSPPPADMLRELAAADLITTEQAELQSRLPVAEDLTIEADSGGHTDNRSLRVIYPSIDRLRRRLTDRYAYARPIRLGAAGGLGTPFSVACAFQLGADYVVTGSVNQAAVESGLSIVGRRLLADCDIADVAMAPAADMFERGVRVQVLKKGTMFHVKAQRLYELYRRHDGLAGISERDREWIEKQILSGSLDAAWGVTRSYHETRNPALVAKADADPKQQMALVFRRYLFMAAQWAREGSNDRQIDYQIWCGPAMGAFNEWVRGSYLEPLENRTVEQIGFNLLEGACVFQRGQQLRAAGVEVPGDLFHFTPRRVRSMH